MKGSSFTTFLMFLPLIAIPAIAIFGIPEFTPVKASANTPLDPVVKAPGTQPGHSHSKSDFAPYPGGNDKATTGGMNKDPFLFPEKSDANPFPNPKGLKGWEVDSKRNDGRQPQSSEKSPFDNSRSITESDKPAPMKTGNGQFAVPSETELTWSNAMQRLKKFGITEYVLQPGSQTDACHFSCLYRSPNNPRITRRFEAEGPSPLKAAASVLAQLENGK